MFSLLNLILCSMVWFFPLSSFADEIYTPRETTGISGYLKIKPLSQMKEGVMGITHTYGVERGRTFNQEIFDNFWKYSGLKWIREIPLGWTGVPGIYDWERADAFYKKILGNGWKPFILLHPAIAKFRPPCEQIQFKMEGEKSGGKNLVLYVDESTPIKRGCSEKDRAIAIKRWRVYQNYITAFARRYKGKINHFELWNEPTHRNLRVGINISREPFSVQYGKSAKALYKAIKKGNPGAKVMVGSLVAASLNRSDHADIHGHLNLHKRALSIIGPENYDIYSWHAYRLCDVCPKPSARTPEAGVSYGEDLKYFPWKTFEEEIAEIYKVASMDGEKPGVEIWNTESGFTFYDNCHRGRSQAPQFFNHAKWYTRHFVMLFGSNPYVKKWIIFSGRVEPAFYKECPFTPRSLVNAGNPPYKRLAYYTASYLGSVFETDDLAPAGLKIQFRNTNTPGFREKPRAVSLEKDGKDIFIGYWIPDEMDDKYKTPGRTDLMVNRLFSKPVLLYLADNPAIPPGHPQSKWGAVEPVRNFSVSGNFTTFKNLPVTDYVYFIGEENEVNWDYSGGG